MTNENFNSSNDIQNVEDVANNSDIDTEEMDELRELDKLNDDTLDSEELRELDTDSEDSANQAETSEVSAEPAFVEVVGVRFKKNGKIYYFSPADMKLTDGTDVVVDTSRGIEYGTVCMPNREIRSSEVVMPIRNVLRLATPEDTERRRRNEDLEISAYNTFIERIDAHQLEMKLIDVECAFDNSRLLFYFSAEGRIDFRELVRELASIFHTRIELRQIGIRDEAKMLGGIGICGRPFCCSSFLSDFVQVSMKMAKEQNLAMNSSKISGACGRLMCCLRYEYDTYLAEKALTPPVGSEVMTPDGEGVVTEANPMTGIVKVRLGGTASDEAPVLFVREDLVLKEKYNGEVLKKTPLPKKRNDNNGAGIFGGLPFNGTADRADGGETTESEEEKKNNASQNDRSNKKDSKRKRDDRPSHANAEGDKNGDRSELSKDKNAADKRASEQPSEAVESAENPELSSAKPSKNNRHNGGRDRRNQKGGRRFDNRPKESEATVNTAQDTAAASHAQGGNTQSGNAQGSDGSQKKNKFDNHGRYGKNKKGNQRSNGGERTQNPEHTPTAPQRDPATQATQSPQNAANNKNQGNPPQHSQNQKNRDEDGKKQPRPFPRHGKPRYRNNGNGGNGGNSGNKSNGGDSKN